MIPEIVTHFDGIEFEKELDFKKWVRELRGKSKTYTCDGVMIELANGDLYGVPFFFFSDRDLEILEPGWEEWLAAEEDERAREQQSLSLQAQAAANRDRDQKKRQVAMLHLQLQGYDAGLFDLWEVALMPANGRGAPLRVVVPGRDSRQAAAAAQAKHPNYRVGSVSKVSRKN